MDFDYFSSSTIVKENIYIYKNISVCTKVLRNKVDVLGIIYYLFQNLSVTDPMAKWSNCTMLMC